jgi:hypothetical protein
MNSRKIFFVALFALLVSTAGYSQMMDIAAIGTYNPLQPSFWSVGYMVSFTGDYDGNNAHFVRIGMTIGKTTLTYEMENPYTSTHEKTEYWQSGGYIDWIFGYVFQLGLGNIFALRFGADYFVSYSGAYMYSGYGGIPKNEMPFNTGLTGTIGLALFPTGRFFAHIDACPGFTLNPLKTGSEVFAFIVPIRLSVGIKKKK